MARAANEHDTGIDPAMVVDLARQTIALTGNASFCTQTDRRKSLLAKISPESLDLPDDASLFGATELFGKKFKKARCLKSLNMTKYLIIWLETMAARNNNQLVEARVFERGLGRGLATATDRPVAPSLSSEGETSDKLLLHSGTARSGTKKSRVFNQRKNNFRYCKSTPSSPKSPFKTKAPNL